VKNIFSRHLETPLLSFSILYQLLKADRPSTKNPIAHPQKTRSPITKKPDRPSPKNPIAHHQKTRSPITKKPDRGAPETGFLRQYLVITHRFGQKPGFLDWRVAQKPGFYRNTSLQPTDSGKNPVSWIIARR
jgi:hypothetical protein